MSLVTICDFCLKEINQATTRVSAQTVDDQNTAANESVAFDFHPQCFNELQRMIVNARPEPEPIEPEPVDPEPQPAPEPTPDVDVEPPPADGEADAPSPEVNNGGV